MYVHKRVYITIICMRSQPFGSTCVCITCTCIYMYMHLETYLCENLCMHPMSNRFDEKPLARAKLPAATYTMYNYTCTYVDVNIMYDEWHFC